MNNENEDVKKDNEVSKEEEVIEILDNANEDEVLESQEVIFDEEEQVIAKEELEIKEGSKKSSFGMKLLASLLDQLFCAGTSVIILFVISVIIRMVGYRFVLIGNYSMFIIIYIIMNILYVPILESTKMKNTFGKSFLKI